MSTVIGFNKTGVEAFSVADERFIIQCIVGNTGTPKTIHAIHYSLQEGNVTAPQWSNTTGVCARLLILDGAFDESEKEQINPFSNDIQDGYQIIADYKIRQLGPGVVEFPGGWTFAADRLITVVLSAPVFDGDIFPTTLTASIGSLMVFGSIQGGNNPFPHLR